MANYDLSRIMKKAWSIYYKESVDFAESLRRAWYGVKAIDINRNTIETAKKAAGIVEETKTWNEWNQMGYEVIHGSKALFGCNLIWASKGKNVIYKARFFGVSQVRQIG